MANLTLIEKAKLEKLLGMGRGYVLGFSNKTFEEFVTDSTGKNIYENKYENGSGSKANRLRAFWEQEPNGVVGKLISDLLEYRKSFSPTGNETMEGLHQDCCRIAQRLLATRLDSKTPDADAQLPDHRNSPYATLQPPGAAPEQVGLAFARGSIMPDPKKVFIIHGRNTKARDELGIFVRSLGLSPINFMDLRASMGGTPTVAEIVERGMDQAQGVIALITADEYAAVRPDFRYPHDQFDEIQRWQARPNVIFEAGMAFGRDRKRVVFVLLGNPKLFTDVAGIHVLRPNNDPSSDRATLRTTLSRGMGCDIELHSTDWMRSGDFETCVKLLPEVSPRDPFRD